MIDGCYGDCCVMWHDLKRWLPTFQLLNPNEHSPPFKFATVPYGSTESHLMANYPEMYLYMKPYNKSTVHDGIKAVKDG